MTDVEIISGAVHDDVGPVTTFVGSTDAGKKWTKEWTGSSNWAGTIESSEADGVASCMEADGLTLSEWPGLGHE